MALLAPATVAVDSRLSGATPRSGVAFGLEIVGGFPAPGLWTGGSLPRQVSLELVAPEALASSGPGWEPRCRVPLDDAGRKLRLDEHREHGYLLRADGFGSYLIARDGRRVALAPGPVAAWRWQRLLTAQVLPIASLAQGLELFHASAVEVDGRVVAIAGGSGAGKTTLAARLMLSGAGFVSDDVLAVEGAASGLVAHSGPPLMNLRESAADLLGPGERSRLGTELGSDEGGPRLLVCRSAAALPLGTVCILKRSTGRQSGVRVTRLSPPGPDMLLGAGFGTTIRTPARLIRRLDLCARLARSTPVVMVEAAVHAPPRTVAAATLRAIRSNS
jgi:hypothetical protein